MEQAGVNSIQLIEAKNLFIQYNSDNTIVQLATDGATIEITAAYNKNLTIKEQSNNLFKYEIDFIDLNYEVINKIRKSIYGFLAVLKLNGGQTKIIPIPLNYQSSKQNNNISASYSTKITNFEATKKKIVAFNPVPIPWILETGFWNDNNYWLNSANWID